MAGNLMIPLGRGEGGTPLPNSKYGWKAEKMRQAGTWSVRDAHAHAFPAEHSQTFLQVGDQIVDMLDAHG